MNQLQYYEIPEWVAMVFLMTITIPFILICKLVWKVFRKHASRMPFLVVVGFFITYLLYVSLAARQGWFNQVFFPPKVLLLSTFPYALLLFLLLPRLKAFHTWYQAVSLEDLIGLHIFRIVGSFFLILAYYDALPKTFAYLAGTGDVLTALLSIWIVRLLRQKDPNAKSMAFAWNVFGTVDILFTAIGANVLTKLSIDTGSMGVDTLAFFPFCIIPAFAPPTILFLHWLIFKKIKEFQA